jgi:hypothetical protein
LLILRFLPEEILVARDRNDEMRKWEKK